MTEPIRSEPFLNRPAPRCLARTARVASESPVDRPPLRRVHWPLRATFQSWALRVLVDRSRKPS